jgi:glyoxylase-like metal-dependent hydrolase (beta-lactamase superfamily II)
MSNARPPNVSIPYSDNVVSVAIIDTRSTITAPAAAFLKPVLKGYEFWKAPVFTFLVQNQQQNRTILFDLGVRKDWENLPPGLVKRLKGMGFQVDTGKNVREILDDEGIDTSADNIEAIIWSHGHFDHTGDPSTFDAGTALVVGPGFRENVLPGYPTNPNSSVLDSDFAGREVREISFDEAQLKIGQFGAFDYFGDGSFYLLNAPGHAHGHMCGLARVTSNPASFVLLGGDAAHHGAELRPSQWLPLPDRLPSFSRTDATFCPGDLCAKLSEESSATTPMYKPTDAGSHLNAAMTIETIGKVQELDALESIFVMLAHDTSLLDVVDFFPSTVGDFGKREWKSKVRWAFLKEFELQSGLS